MTAAAVERRSWVLPVMGLPVSLHVRGEGVRSAPAVRRAVPVVFGRLRFADRMFSPYREDSEVSRIRRGERPSGHPWMTEVLALCELARERTDGYFDARLPGGFDPSGLVKSWAVEQSVAALADLEGFDYCLNAGGDVLAAVRSAASPAWRVGVEDPRDRSRLVAVREIRSGGVATSGSAARGAHIVDPHTGARPDTLLSVTVTGPSLLWADVFATAAFARGGDVESWVRARAPGYEAFAVGPDP